MVDFLWQLSVGKHTKFVPLILPGFLGSSSVVVVNIDRTEFACQAAHPRVVYFLLERKASIDAIDAGGGDMGPLRSPKN